MSSTGPTTEPLPGRPGPAVRVALPVPVLSQPVRRFLATESGSAVLLLLATAAALVWANLPGGTYQTVWETTAGVTLGDAGLTMDLGHWVNDALMAVFFCTVGLEISREVTVGHLRSPRAVVVPALGAVGGLVVPALLFFAFTAGTPAAVGWGIPISTDTAFLVGMLALFGPRCPDRLRLFLLTLAIVDDIGAVTVMAVFYSHGVSVPALLLSALLLAVLVGLRLAGEWRLTPYVVVGIALWGAVHASGVHATLAGVLVGLVVPATAVEPEQRDRVRAFGRALIERADPTRVRLATSAVRASVPPNDRLQAALHPLSAFLVVPLFGLANAGVSLSGETLRAAVGSPLTWGVVVALVVGKTAGIAVAAGLALKFRLGDLPGRVRYGHLVGGAMMAGIGFTLSLFITDLAFDDPVLQAEAKIGVLAGSLLAAVLGALVLRVLGERLPLCSPDLDDDGGLPALPSGPWTDPTRT
ncbi:Na+/H+ antiporter NhaA [Streptomyces sp. NP160]|uniref:Na+/H+ antiporter NhaA n=1 Tax=Streptomyces sp. NP160 TaxID=2586637 RepID=UPI001119F86E|nr:Na+/H+ antiporter NhaA [Streptomyces sp. NP160]TNM59685.1 Na+/H+ antiporter NhaA [Streptomyces sp. NP160]